MKHTHENLERVADIRNELDTQLQRLQKQSKAAAKYKELKQAERETRAQLLAIRWRDLDARLQDQDAQLSKHQTLLDAALAEQRGIEAEIEKIRARQTEAADEHGVVQAEFYSIGAEISRLEQAIEHARETRQVQLREQEQLEQSWAEVSAHLQADRQRMAELDRRLQDCAPGLADEERQRDDAAAGRCRAEEAMQAWQNEWEAFSTRSAEPTKLRDLQDARIQSLEQHVWELTERQTRLKEEARAIEVELGEEPADALRAEAMELDQTCEKLEQSVQTTERRMREARARREELSDELDARRGDLQNAEARLAGLRELQAAAEAHDDTELQDWLLRHDLGQAQRLAGKLSVEAGWERATERVLGAKLAGVCVKELDRLAVDAARVKPSELTLIDQSMSAIEGETPPHPRLTDKLKADVDLGSLLGDVYVADNLDEAMSWRGGLAVHESVITRAGEWLGRNWLNLGNEKDARAGWILRERELEELAKLVTDLRGQTEQFQQQLTQTLEQVDTLEGERDELTLGLNDKHRARAALREKLGHKQAHLAQLEARRTQILREQAELSEQLNRDHTGIEQATELLQQAETTSGTHETERAQLQDRRQTLQQELERARTAEIEARDHRHRLEIERQAITTEFDATKGSITRLEGQVNHLSARREELRQMLARGDQPENEHKRQLDESLGKRLTVEQKLNAARQAVSDLENNQREQEQARQAQEEKVQEIRSAMESERMARQELLVRRDTHAEQAKETGSDIAQVLQELPSEAEDGAWNERLEKLVTRIERLGPINLVAIEEYEEQSQRKAYIDKQYEDLSQALNTLTEAIRKIDRETRMRFKETYDKVNEGYQNFFPQLFGGGNAYLELTDNDLLETGVTVMARPPGKRNSTIHLLSGGEKALTAVGLLFAIFELSPAPFCLLDEVDAPLDDANVERYCETLKTLSQRTQLVYVTHNKISMEMANVLIGITMSEPGVSRLVAVDVEEALEMVAQ
jgi:chromosome segregation protein